MARTKNAGVLRDWTEDEGTPIARRALVATGPFDSFVAYVGVPADHVLAGRDYDDMPLEVHGGLTFGSAGGRGIWEAGWYWYGWDYSHSGDFMSFAPRMGGRRWTVEEVEAEAREALEQLKRLLLEEMVD